MRMLEEEDANDVEVSWADQQKINQFSRLNQRQTDAQLTLEALRVEKEQVEEMFEEVQMLELSEDSEGDSETEDVDDDDDDNDADASKSRTIKGQVIPFKIGDAFALVTLERAVALLELERSRLEREIDEVAAQVDACEQGMKPLKVGLYAKFGSNINLERD